MAVKADDILYGSWEPVAAPNTLALDQFFDKVRSESGGIINFRPFHSGTLVNVRSSLAGIRDGLVDAANIAGSQTPASLPIDFFYQNHAAILSEPAVSVPGGHRNKFSRL